MASSSSLASSASRTPPTIAEDVFRLSTASSAAASSPLSRDVARRLIALVPHLGVVPARIPWPRPGCPAVIRGPGGRRGPRAGRVATSSGPPLGAGPAPAGEAVGGEPVFASPSSGHLGKDMCPRYLLRRPVSRDSGVSCGKLVAFRVIPRFCRVGLLRCPGATRPLKVVDRR